MFIYSNRCWIKFSYLVLRCFVLSVTLIQYLLTSLVCLLIILDSIEHGGYKQDVAFEGNGVRCGIVYVYVCL